MRWMGSPVPAACSGSTSLPHSCAAALSTTSTRCTSAPCRQRHNGPPAAARGRRSSRSPSTTTVTASSRHACPASQSARPATTPPGASPTCTSHTATGSCCAAGWPHKRLTARQRTQRCASAAEWRLSTLCWRRRTYTSCTHCTRRSRLKLASHNHSTLLSASAGNRPTSPARSVAERSTRPATARPSQRTGRRRAGQ